MPIQCRSRYLCDQRSPLLAVAISALLLGISSCSAQDSAPRTQSLQLLGNISDKQITESSGLGMSKLNPDAFWTLNDSGHPSEVFLVSNEGKTLLRCNLKDTRSIDWEAMAAYRSDNVDWLLVADVGDNSLNRKRYQLYLLPEPKCSPLDAQASRSKQKSKKSKKREKRKKNAPQEVSVTPTKIHFRYSDGSHNCEAVGVDVISKTVWLIDKVYSNDSSGRLPKIYSLPIESKQDGEPLVAQYVADYPFRNVTGMEFSPDGKRLIVRNYLNAHMYTRSGNQTWEQTVKAGPPEPVVLPLQSQGEAICFTPDSKSVVITSEFARSTIWKVDLPELE